MGKQTESNVCHISKRNIVEKDPLQSSAPAVIYVSLEYCLNDLFSGNGVAARSHVRGLSQSHWMHVIVGRPKGAQAPVSADTPGRTVLYECPLDKWRSTDRDSDHTLFARLAGAVLNQIVTENVDLVSSLRAVMVVDWTGSAAVEAMNGALRDRLLAATPMFFLNFRLYTRMTEISKNDRDFYYEVESKSVYRTLSSGGGVMSLSPNDDAMLQDMYVKACEDSSSIQRDASEEQRTDDGRNARASDAVLVPSLTSNLRQHKGFKVILPMLREEFSFIAHREKDAILAQRNRKYFICIVRLSKDKGPQRFVDVCEAISVKDPTFWIRTGIRPLLAGSPSQQPFADEIKARFKERIPCGVVIDEFLSPQSLSLILSEAIANFHPSIYEVGESHRCPWRMYEAHVLLNSPLVLLSDTICFLFLRLMASLPKGIRYDYC